LHMAQLMPLPLTVSCFSKIQIGFALLIPAHPGSLGQKAVKQVLLLLLLLLLSGLMRLTMLITPGTGGASKGKVRRYQNKMIKKYVLNIVAVNCLKNISRKFKYSVTVTLKLTLCIKIYHLDICHAV